MGFLHLYKSVITYVAGSGGKKFRIYFLLDGEICRPSPASAVDYMMRMLVRRRS